MKAFHIFAGSVSLVVSIAILNLWPASNTPAPTPQASRADSALSVVEKNGPATRLGSLTWTKGDRATWELAATIRLAESPAAGAITGETKLAARVHAIVLDASPREVTLAAAVSGSEYRQEQSRVPTIEELINATPAIISLKPDGTLKSVAFPAGISDEDKQVLMLVHGWEFVVRPMASYDALEFVSNDEAPTFHATYRRERDGLSVKTRTVPQPDPDAVSRQEIVSSQFTGRPGHLWLASLEGSEETRVFMGDSMLVAPTIHISLNEVDTEPLPDVLKTLGSATAEQRLALFNHAAPVKSVAAQMKAEVLRKKWGPISLPQVMEPLRKVAGKPMTEVVGPMHDVRDWLSVHPELVDAVLFKLQGSDDGEVSAMMVQAMTGGEPETANTALASIVIDPGQYPPAVVIQAAASAGQLGAKAGEPLITALSDRYSAALQGGQFELADATVLSLARIAQENSTVRESIVKTFTPDLAPGADPDDSAMALMVLENAKIARPEVIAQASELAKVGTLEVQTAALSYLGSVPVSPDIDRDLISAMKTSNPLIQDAARSALSREGRFRSVLVQQALTAAPTQLRDE